MSATYGGLKALTASRTQVKHCLHSSPVRLISKSTKDINTLNNNNNKNENVNNEFESKNVENNNHNIVNNNNHNTTTLPTLNGSRKYGTVVQNGGSEVNGNHESSEKGSYGIESCVVFSLDLVNNKIESVKNISTKTTRMSQLKAEETDHSHSLKNSPTLKNPITLNNSSTLNSPLASKNAPTLKNAITLSNSSTSKNSPTLKKSLTLKISHDLKNSSLEPRNENEGNQRQSLIGEFKNKNPEKMPVRKRGILFPFNRMYRKEINLEEAPAGKKYHPSSSPYDGEPSDLLDVGGSENEAMPVIRKKEREYMGMFEYDRRDEMQIIRIIIYDLKPRVAVMLLPGLPAYILFMCIRHADHINDDDKVRSLLNNIVNGLKRVVRKRQEDLESTIMWLSNTLRLMHNLKQYSGDKEFQSENTAKQNDQALNNFDLSEYRQLLSDVGVWIYNAVIKSMEEKVQPLIVPSVLEHEAITGLSGNKPGGMRGRAGSVAKELESPVELQKAMDLMLKELTQFYRSLAMFGTDPELITQVFKQIFYFICAGSLNNLLLRKDMCHWSKGMQIRFNISHLEQWARDMRLQETGVIDALAPVVQAAQLLQARKTDDDVDSICEMCDKLSVNQIIKILNLYTPADEFEERVPISFIHKIQAKLQSRAEGEQALQSNLLLNTKYAFPVRFPFNPSSIRLEDIELPDVLALSFLKKI